MNERPDDRIDHELSGIAMAAAVEHEDSVSIEEIEAALVAVRDRAAESGAGARATTLAARSDRIRQRSPWVLIGSAAAVLALLGGGLAVVLGDGPDDRLVPATVPAPTPDPTVVPSTLPEGSDLPTTAPPTTEVADGTTDDTATVVEPQTLTVDAANPPRLVEPVPYASVPLAPNPNGQPTEFAVGLDHVIVNQPDTGSFTVVGPDGSAREVPVEEDMNQVVSGPGPVVYGLGGPVFSDDSQAMPDAFRFVAIPFLGEREGEVVASTELGVNEYLELPPFFFGHGSDGIIARGRSNDTVIGYVDEQGEMRDSGEFGEFGVSFPRYDLDRRGSVLVVDEIGSERAWELDITRDIGWSQPFIDEPVVAPGAGRAVYFERIGLNTTPNSDFGTNLMPVVALMNSDGSGEWIRLPDDWDVVASDVWGTLLARFTGDAIELASLEDVVPVPDPNAGNGGATPEPETPTPTAPDSPLQPTAIDEECVEGGGCTSLANTEDGRIVSLDPVGTVLRVFDSTGRESLFDVPVAGGFGGRLPFLVAVGPDDVAYVSALTPDEGDATRNLSAVPLAGPAAGTVIERWDGLDGSGDSELERSATGLVVVGCCGPEPVRPASDARIFEWVDRNGDPVASTAPFFTLGLSGGENELTRIDPVTGEQAAFPLPSALQFPRGFPLVTARPDGVLLVDLVQQSELFWVFVEYRGERPDFDFDNGDVSYRRDEGIRGVALVEPTGTVIVSVAEGGFERQTIEQVGEAGWPGRASVDTSVEGWPIDAEGLNDYVESEQPFWASVPTLYAFQFKQFLQPGEAVVVDFDESSGVIEITTSGLRDDSVSAQRFTIVVEDGPDGLFRFVSGSASQQCARGGSDAFVSDLCV